MTLDELKQFMNWTDNEEATFEAVAWMVGVRDWEIESLKAEIRRLNEQLVAQARSDDRNALLERFEAVFAQIKAREPAAKRPFVGTCDGDLEP